MLLVYEEMYVKKSFEYCKVPHKASGAAVRRGVINNEKYQCSSPKATEESFGFL